MNTIRIYKQRCKHMWEVVSQYQPPYIERDDSNEWSPNSIKEKLRKRHAGHQIIVYLSERKRDRQYMKFFNH